MDDQLLAALSDGPIPFEEFQYLALYGSGGFFTKGEVRSTTTGDFLTSPEVSSWFGKAIGDWCAQLIEPGTDGPGERVIDAGAGSGSLLLAMEQQFDLWAVEISPPAVGALRDGDISVASDLDEIASDVAEVVVANELLDNLVVALAVKTEAGWEERWVAGDATSRELVAHPARPEVAEWAGRFCGDVPVGGMVEVQLSAADWLAKLMGRPQLRGALLIDYGDTAEGLLPRRTLGTLRTYRAHHLGPDPLLEPGETDITVDVNFTALVAVAEAAGFRVRLLRQDDFLTEMGLREELSRLRHQELELAKGQDQMSRLKVRSEATGLETLLHPRGLGDFRVLEILR